MNVVPDKDLMVTRSSYDLISEEKALVSLESGCVWCYLMQDGERIGIAFAGPSKFAVDAIAETEKGAVGESLTGMLGGIQLYLGDHGLESLSVRALDEDLSRAGFTSPATYLEGVKDKLQNGNGGDRKLKISDEPEGSILIGSDQHEKDLVLVARDDRLVFTYNKRVFVLKEDELVSVTKGGVLIKKHDGKTLRVGKGGISGLEGFTGIRIDEVVGKAMQGLRGLKKLKSLKRTMRHLPRSYDDVDAIDWDDDE